jgi:hypothetical protein
VDNGSAHPAQLFECSRAQAFTNDAAIIFNSASADALRPLSDHGELGRYADLELPMPRQDRLRRRPARLPRPR